MKPLQLSMTAFGPYKEKETIDFTKLADNHLFVISGATGAGKTTIFDAISFALYGTASGSDRENTSMLRSHFADDDVHTAVELIFELNGRTYRVFRQLGHVKAGNKSRTGERYEFYEKRSDGSEVPCIDRQIVTEMNEKLEAIIGLTQDQFKQIVMLPQGEFRKLLTSETENKEAILRRLFKTERYDAINGILKAKKAAVNERFNQEQKMIEHYIQRIYATVEKRENSTLFTLLDQEYYNVEQVINELEKEMTYLQNEMNKNDDDYAKTLKQFNQKQAYLHKAIALNKQFVSLAEKKNELVKLAEQKQTYLGKEQQVVAAERAIKLEPYEQQVNERRSELREKESHVQVVMSQLDSTKRHLAATKEAYIVEEKREEEREQLKRDGERFVEFLPTVKVIDETKQSLYILTTEISKLTNDVVTTTTFIETKEVEVERMKIALSEKEKRVSERSNKQDERHHLRNQYKVFVDYQKLSKQHKQIQIRVKEKETIFTKAEEFYKQLEANWLNNQAAILASHLHDGDSCPVCGSTSHPDKAAVGTSDITKEALDEAKADVETKQAIYQTVLVDYRAITSQLKAQAEEVASYGVSLDQLDTKIAVILKYGQQLKIEIEALDQLAEEIVRDKSLIEKLDNDMKQARKQREQFEQKLSTKQLEFNRLDATFKEQIRNIPEEIQDLQNLEAKIAETEKQKNKLDKRWSEIQEQLQQADKNYTAAELQVGNGKADLEKLKAIVEKVEAQFKAQLTAAKFENEMMYKQAKMTTDERETLIKQIEQYKQETITLHKYIEELTEELEGKEKADIPSIEAQVNELKLAYESAFEKLNRTKNDYSKVMSIKENILNVQTAVESLEKELAVVSDLYDVLRGQNMKKISFERYLQIDYLDQITAAANERFKSLTNGQFYLIRSDRQETHGKQSGLAIDVYDSYTGQTRDVKTLSGGEKFIASLCLALGMSDVIQSFQGGISMDTMFIDEGFGSLDEESLHKSIDALISLQQTGRMIGVISHVEELKTIFPAMLEVKKTKEGNSKTNIVLK